MYKVLYVAGSSGIGGAETFLKQTLNQVDSQNFQNHYLLFHHGPLYDFLKNAGARVTLLSSPPRLSKIGDHQMVASEIRKIINDSGIDLVHSTMAYTALFTARPCKGLGIPHVWFQHGPASGWMDRMASVLPHQGLIVNSHYTGKRQRQLENPVRFLIPRKIPIEKILLGTEIRTPELSIVSQQRQKLLQTLGLTDETVVVSMLCRLQKWKGVHLFLEAMEQLKKLKLEQNFHGVIWGDAFKSDDYKESLQRQITESQLPVTLMGPSHNAAESLASSNILVNASIQPEPFGLSIVEAMMVGCVPVVPNEGGPIETVTNGKEGLVFEARDVASLARNLETLISDQTLLGKLSEQALETAQNKYTADRVIRHLETFHTRVIESMC